MYSDLPAVHGDVCGDVRASASVAFPRGRLAGRATETASGAETGGVGVRHLRACVRVRLRHVLRVDQWPRLRLAIHQLEHRLRRSRLHQRVHSARHLAQCAQQIHHDDRLELWLPPPS